MRIVTHKKHKIQFYDSPRDLPIRRYAKYNKHLMLQMEVGSDITDYDKRMLRANGYLANEDIKSAKIELTNQRQCVHNALTEYSPNGMALATMVHSIDGRLTHVRTDEDLSVIIDKLDKIGFTKAMMDETIEAVKKK